MYWEFSPDWNGWFLMLPEDGPTARRGYGPFMTDWEIQAAAAVHEVPFAAAKKEGDKP